MRRIGGRNDGDHPGQRDVGQLGAAEPARHIDRPQAALREGVEFGDRQATRPIALGRALHELRRQCVGDGDRLGVVLDDVRGLARPRQGRNALDNALDLALHAHVPLLVLAGRPPVGPLLDLADHEAAGHVGHPVGELDLVAG